MNNTTPTLSHCTVLDLVPFGNLGHSSGLYALRLSTPEWPTWHPGQFVMLRSPSGNQKSPFARPFAICRLSKHSLVLFFQNKGIVTNQLAKLKPEDTVEIWGPLGNAFAMEPDNETLIIAGGIGIAPFVSYVQKHIAPWNISLLFGHTMPIDCYPFDNFNEKIIADEFFDKNPGDTKIFAEMVESRIAEHASTTKGKGLILSCGPMPLLKKVQEASKKHNVRAQISLETRMACGIGACLGCVVKTLPDGIEVRNPHHAQTCTCGPNFWASNVLL